MIAPSCSSAGRPFQATQELFLGDARLALGATVGTSTAHTEAALDAGAWLVDPVPAAVNAFHRVRYRIAPGVQDQAVSPTNPCAHST